jgi:hypothetical protein
MARVYRLANTTGTGAQEPVYFADQRNRDEALLQIEFASTGSVTIEGRINPEMSWITIAGPYTQDTIVPIAWVPTMRVNIASNGSGITALLASS